MVKHFSKNDNFNEIISKGKILVDFYADWCGPCKMLAPVLEQLQTIEVLKVNVDEFEDLASKYGIMSIPSLILFENGKIVHQEVGFKNLDDLKKMIQN
jgi:thioredoxin 1